LGVGGGSMGGVGWISLDLGAHEARTHRKIRIPANLLIFFLSFLVIIFSSFGMISMEK
jgi:hypothetical protein